MLLVSVVQQSGSLPHIAFLLYFSSIGYNEQGTHVLYSGTLLFIYFVYSSFFFMYIGKYLFLVEQH